MRRACRRPVPKATIVAVRAGADPLQRPAAPHEPPALKNVRRGGSSGRSVTIGLRFFPRINHRNEYGKSPFGGFWPVLRAIQ